ncbi:MAG TPA: hypothetical protein RMH85_34540 [Polyangiaceae bacterium LLY-WYZ-15_(1-7)]|nr:hypothetical protein [Myxococcales bacterium]MAT28858.1 hypothetical protein [Sandaracinus sp.]HJL02957.1 hypothetical protein [Polyangiaceae bacterium LLY-WYZ-15_(1-7)]MBJ74089.1 hypothetical protein [Sandaracinus sp.]HJL13655.1 hypothetical protein [Polyangiaceae bacterium LLY-WYZ-15_(1-7)]
MRTPDGLLGLVALSLSLALASPASAQTGIDLIENFFGAANVEAITGHGRLSVGVSKDGELTVLSWPSPSYSDQLGYLNSNALDARARPRFGAPEGTGATFGLLVDDGTDGPPIVHWLHDRSAWTASTSYGPDDGANPHTVFSNERLGLRVTVVDAVAPAPVGGADVLVREVRVVREEGSPVLSAELLTFANLSPMPPESRIPQLPFVDWAFDGRNDFAAVWDEDAQAIVHFHPGDQRIYDVIGDVLNAPEVDFGAIGAALRDGSPDADAIAALAAALDEDYAPGAYAALTTVPAPTQHQIGFDASDFCGIQDELVDNVRALPEVFEEVELPLDPDVLDALRCDPEAPTLAEENGWTHDAADAWADAADGALEGNGLAAGEVNEALRTPLLFEGDEAVARAVFSFGRDAATARAGLAVDAAAVVGESDAALAAFLEDKRLPTWDEDVRRVARRSLINIRVGTDAETGAIVASITRQAPYGLDWPRDGAFFNVLLDVSGQHELVTRRATLYQAWQRAEPVRPTFVIDPEPPPNPDGTPSRFYPADAWEMNYYADGMIGGFFRFEIDNTGFSVWTIVAHAGWVDDPESYLRDHWEAIRRGADLLTRWRDPETGLPAPAQEDDNAAYTQTLHGSVTTFGALEIASRAARLLGEVEDAERWEERAGELRDAMLASFYDFEEERFISEAPTGPQRATAAQNPGSTPTGPTAWLVWPMTLLPLDDARIERQLELDRETIRPTVELENEGGSYFMKNTVSLGVARGMDPAWRDDLLELTRRTAAQATATDHYGEVMVVVEEADGTRRPSQRVSTPHLWEGALFYLTAMALEEPEALMAYEDVLPPSEVRSAGGVSGGSCDCRIERAPSEGPSAAWALLVVPAIVVARLRR